MLAVCQILRQADFQCTLYLRLDVQGHAFSALPSLLLHVTQNVFNRLRSYVVVFLLLCLLYCEDIKICLIKEFRKVIF
jgi:hypothetical protein